MGKDSPYAQKLDNVQGVLRKLRDAGHEAWLNGGCVRDHLLGREPADFDVATSATPDQVEAIFQRSIPVGKAFGVIRVANRGDWFEVATFRRDGRYLDGRHPASISFSTAAEDAARRDFTINGMFWDPISGEIRDYVGGRQDLERRIVRAIGDPDARLSEDALRILRAIRFAATDAFTLDPATRDALVRHRDRLRQVAAERIREELNKLSAGSAETRRRGILLLGECRLLEILFEEEGAIDPRRSSEVAARSETPSLALFLAAILGGALPEDTRPPAWRALAQRAGGRLRLSNDELETLGDLLATRIRARGAARTSVARRRLLATMPRYGLVRELLIAEDGATDAVRLLDDARKALGGVRPRPLLDGHDLLQLGVPPRRSVGLWLKRIQMLGLSGRITTKEEAAAYVRARLRPRE